MPVDTVSQVIPPPEARADIRARYPLPADSPTLVIEDARPIDVVEYRGRHRDTTTPHRPEPWNPDPEWFPSEETRELSAHRATVAVPLPQREEGATLPVVEALHVVRATGPLAVLMRAKQWIRVGRTGGN